MIFNEQSPNMNVGALILLSSFVFLPGGHAAADVAFLFVQFKDLTYLLVEYPAAPWKPAVPSVS